jgi:hypothetical protein
MRYFFIFSDLVVWDVATRNILRSSRIVLKRHVKSLGGEGRRGRVGKGGRGGVGIHTARLLTLLRCEEGKEKENL